jgi:integrase
MATSGLRRAELASVDWPDVDLRAQRLRIRGNGDKHREVLIFQELLAALYTLHAEQRFPTEGPVFRGWRGRRLQMSTLQRWFTKAGLRHPGAPHYTLHSLRRFAAKSWLNAGLNIRQVQLLLGHEDLQTTMLYLNYDIEEIQHDAAGVTFHLTTPTLPA